MSGSASHHPEDADRLEQLTENLTMSESSTVWDIYGARGYDAAAIAAKSYNGAFKSRFKVTSDAPPEALAALDAAFERLGDWQKVTAALAQLGAPVKARVLTDRGDQSVLPTATKTYNPATDFYAAALGADQTKGKTR